MSFIQIFFQENYDEHQAIGVAAAAKLFSFHGVQYAVGSSNEINCKQNFDAIKINFVTAIYF